MAKRAVFVTGDKELDAKLAAMTPALEKKFIRGALRTSGKRVVKETQRIVKAEAYDTGALYKSLKVIALKRSRKRIGIAVLPTRDKLFANYAARHGGKKPHPAADETEPFYYAASIEFGTETHEAIRPQRRALYDNADVYIEYFKADLRTFIKEQKVSTKMAKSTGYTGKNFKK